MNYQFNSEFVYDCGFITFLVMPKTNSNFI